MPRHRRIGLNFDSDQAQGSGRAGLQSAAWHPMGIRLKPKRSGNFQSFSLQELQQLLNRFDLIFPLCQCHFAVRGLPARRTNVKPKDLNLKRDGGKRNDGKRPLQTSSLTIRSKVPGSWCLQPLNAIAGL